MIAIRQMAFFGGVSGLLALSVLTACKHSIEVKEKSPGADSFSAVANDPNRIAPLGYIKTVKVINDGTEGSPSDEFLRRVRNKLLETKLFYDIVFLRPNEPHVELNLTAREKKEQNKAANFTKSMASALTLFLLSPAFPLTYEYSSEFQLSIVNLEGKPKSYNARSSAILDLPAGDQPSMQNAHVDLYRTVTTNNLNSLMSQLIQDADFIMFIRKHIKPIPES